MEWLKRSNYISETADLRGGFTEVASFYSMLVPCKKYDPEYDQDATTGNL